MNASLLALFLAALVGLAIGVAIRSRRGGDTEISKLHDEITMLRGALYDEQHGITATLRADAHEQALARERLRREGNSPLDDLQARAAYEEQCG